MAGRAFVFLEELVLERFIRLDDEHDAAVVSRLVGISEPKLRGWASVRAPLPDASREKALAALAGTRALLLTGTSGAALVGDLSSVLAAGRRLAQVDDADVSGWGASVREAAFHVERGPEPLVLRGATFDWSRPVVVGVVNVTPDSFSDGGRFHAADAAVEHALRLLDEGADVVDVGGESTRPRGQAYGAGAVHVPVEEEIARVVPVIRALRERTSAPISIDTRKSAVARAAIEAGADVINDTTGLMHDAGIATVAAETGAALVLTHVPRDIEQLSHEEPSDDIVGDVLARLRAVLGRALEAGVPRGRVWLDPGIGFGKAADHNLYLLRHPECLAALGCAVFVGASRKSSVARAAVAGGDPLPPDERLGASLGAAVTAYLMGAHVFRVHDVRETVHALRVASAIRSASKAGVLFGG